MKRWHDSVARGSLLTADVYLHRLRQFCLENNVTPQGLLEFKGSMRVEDLLDDDISKMEREGKAGGYIQVVLKSVRSWLGVKLQRKIKIKDASATPTLKDERVPEKEELRTTLNRSTVRLGINTSNRYAHGPFNTRKGGIIDAKSFLEKATTSGSGK